MEGKIKIAGRFFESDSSHFTAWRLDFAMA
jgi:hypothetical protein